MKPLTPYISYSQLNSYEQCPRSWYLRYRRGGEERQAWYIAVGSAVHNMVEEHLKGVPYYDGRSLKAEDFFFPLVSAQMEVEPDLDKWLAAGSKKDPITGDKALQMVRDCFERALEFLEDIDVWEVEYDATGPLPGLSVPVKAYIDIIGESRKRKRPEVWDWKTGSKKPGDFQLKTYGALLKGDKSFRDLKFGGAYIMLKPGASTARPIDLSDVNPAEIGARYEKVRAKMEHTQIQAREDRSKWVCGMCFQQDNCLAWAEMPTQRALYYDHSKQDQPPF